MSSRRWMLLAVVLAMALLAFEAAPAIPVDEAQDRNVVSHTDVTPAPVPTADVDKPLTPAGLSERERVRKESYRPTGGG